MKEASSNEQYLGLPTEWGRSKFQAIQFLKTKMKKILVAWKRSLLNQVGREVLVKSVLTVMPCYAIAYYKLPSIFGESVNKLIRNFWWGKTKDRRKEHWVWWKVLTKPK